MDMTICRIRTTYYTLKSQRQLLLTFKFNNESNEFPQTLKETALLKRTVETKGRQERIKTSGQIMSTKLKLQSLKFASCYGKTTCCNCRRLAQRSKEHNQNTNRITCCHHSICSHLLLTLYGMPPIKSHR